MSLISKNWPPKTLYFLQHSGKCCTTKGKEEKNHFVLSIFCSTYRYSLPLLHAWSEAAAGGGGGGGGGGSCYHKGEGREECGESGDKCKIGIFGKWSVSRRMEKLIQE